MAIRTRLKLDLCLYIFSTARSLSLRQHISSIKNTLGKILVILCTLTISISGFALETDLPDPEAQVTPMVEIEYPPELMLPYRERRPDWSLVAGLRVRQFTPRAYKSEIDGNKFETLFGSRSIVISGFSAGAKYNLSSFSMTGEVFYGTGGIADDRIGDSVDLQLNQAGASLGIWLDMITEDPKAVPYLQGEISQVNYTEKDSAFKASGTSGFAAGAAAGVLIQLNWLDEDAARRGLVESGVNNSYLDLFVAKSSAGGSGPSFETELDYGAGLRMEF